MPFQCDDWTNTTGLAIVPSLTVDVGYVITIGVVVVLPDDVVDVLPEDVVDVFHEAGGGREGVVPLITIASAELLPTLGPQPTHIDIIAQTINKTVTILFINSSKMGFVSPTIS